MNPDPIDISDVLSGKLEKDAQAAGVADTLFRASRGRNVDHDVLTNRYARFLDKIDPDGTFFSKEGPLDALGEPAGKSVRDNMISRFRARLSKGGNIREPRGARSVTEAREAHKAEVAAREKVTTNRLLRWFQREITDRSGEMNAAVIKNAGVQGEQAMMRFDLSAGAPQHGDLVYQSWKKAVFSGLDKDSRGILDEVIQDMRNIQISSYEPNFKFEKNLTRDDFIQHLQGIKKDMGNEQYTELVKRANSYFDAFQSQLDDLAEAGIISAEEMTKLSRFIYQPRKFADTVDPLVIIRHGGKKISVRSSGIQPLGEGSSKAPVLDAQLLLADTVARVQGRIFKNRANQALYTIAKDQPNNGLLHLKRPKEGEWSQLSVMVDGKEKKMYMDSQFAAQWAETASPLSGQAASMLEILSGAPILRALATGVNPEFVLTNLPRDLIYAWLRTNEYSAFWPRAAVQGGIDGIAVAADTFKRGPRYQAYIKEGGGMSFLTHGATSSAAGGLPDKWRRVRDVFGYLNESGEVFVRLMLKERARKNGRTSEEGTFIARDYLDFAKGGNTTKAIDKFVPYTNAASLGLSGIVQTLFNPVTRTFSGKLKPGAPRLLAWGKVTQLMGATAAIWLYNRENHPDVMGQIPAEVKASYWVTPTGMSFTDEKGNIRYNYIKVPVDHSVMAFKTMTEALLDKYVDGKDPTPQMMAAWKNSLSIFGDPIGVLPPTFALLAEYNSDFSFWQNNEIWGDPDIPSEQEVRRFPDATSQLAIDWGEMTGTSPEKSGEAIGNLIPRNLYRDTLVQAYELARNGMPEDYLNKHRDDILRRAPFIRRYLSATHPLANEYEKIKEADRDATGEKFGTTQQLDEMILRHNLGQVSVDAIEGVIEAAPDLEKESLTTRMQASMFLDQVMKSGRIDKFEGAPSSKGWWLLLNGAQGKARAEVFYESWRDQEPSVRRKMERVAVAVPGFYSPEFKYWFEKEKEIRGDDYVPR